MHKNLAFTATEQYKLIRANLDFTLPENEKCPVIGVTSSMRGEGKSTTAVNLSYVFAEKGSKVLLIDADMRIPSIAKKMDIESSPGLSDFDLFDGLAADNAAKASVVLSATVVQNLRRHAQLVSDRLDYLDRTVKACLVVHLLHHPVDEAPEEVSLAKL